MTISERDAEEVARAKQWHDTLAVTTMLFCFRCKALRTFVKSRWVVGRYQCDVCRWSQDTRFAP